MAPQTHIEYYEKCGQVQTFGNSTNESALDARVSEKQIKVRECLLHSVPFVTSK